MNSILNLIIRTIKTHSLNCNNACFVQAVYQIEQPIKHNSFLFLRETFKRLLNG